MVALLKMPSRAQNEATGAERRMFPRKEVHATVLGRRLDHSVTARRQPFLSLALRDLSVGGLSGISRNPLARGERVTVHFPADESGDLPAASWDAYGRVLRCEPSTTGWRVAVEFDPLPAA